MRRKLYDVPNLLIIFSFSVDIWYFINLVIVSSRAPCYGIWIPVHKLTFSNNFIIREFSRTRFALIWINTQQSRLCQLLFCKICNQLHSRELMVQFWFWFTCGSRANITSVLLSQTTPTNFPPFSAYDSSIKNLLNPLRGIKGDFYLHKQFYSSSTFFCFFFLFSFIFY